MAKKDTLEKLALEELQIVPGMVEFSRGLQSQLLQTFFFFFLEKPFQTFRNLNSSLGASPSHLVTHSLL